MVTPATVAALLSVSAACETYIARELCYIYSLTDSCTLLLHTHTEQLYDQEPVRSDDESATEGGQVQVPFGGEATGSLAPLVTICT